MTKYFLPVCFLLFSSKLFAQSEYFKSPVQITIVKLNAVDTVNKIPGTQKYNDGQRFQYGAVFHEGENFRIEIANRDSSKYYYTFLDIQPDNQINVMLPTNSQMPEDMFVLANDTTKLNFFFTVIPPYGVDKFLLIVSKVPMDVRSGLEQTRGRSLAPSISVQDITWILQGQPAAKFKDCRFSLMDVAIIPSDTSKNTGYINRRSTGIASYHLYNTPSLINVITAENCVDRNKDPKVINVYPLMSFLQPLQSMASRGAEDEHEAENKKFILKGTITAFKGIKEVLVNGQKGNITTMTEQQFFWEKEVELSNGKNSFTVTSITNDGKKNCGEVVMVYNEKDKTVSKEGRNYSLFVGINDYKNFNKLTGARKDANDMKDLLQKSYQFDPKYTSELYDGQATKDNIDSVFRNLISVLTPADNVVVYFAGHGVLDKQLNEGYWIPVEARTHKPLDYLSNGEIKKYLEAINAKHVVVLADACFSGGFFKTNRGETYAEKVDQLRSKWLFCSGREEEVSDVMAGQKNSPFAYYLLKFLKEYNGEGLTSSELAQKVKTSVTGNSNQTPISGAIRETGDEGGEFVFKKKK